MKQNSIFLFLLLFFFGNSLNNLQSSKKKENYPEVHVHMEPASVDWKDMMEKSEERRFQKNMIKDLEEKIQLDKQAFQQITSIQNSEIQKLGEAVKIGNYYTMRKIMNAKEKNTKNKGKNEMSFEKKIGLISNPFDLVQDSEGTAKNSIPKNRLENYGEIVDKLYGA